MPCPTPSCPWWCSSGSSSAPSWEGPSSWKSCSTGQARDAWPTTPSSQATTQSCWPSARCARSALAIGGTLADGLFLLIDPRVRFLELERLPRLGDLRLPLGVKRLAALAALALLVSA